MRQDHAAWAREFPGDDQVFHDRVQVDEAGSPSELAHGTLRSRRGVFTAHLERAGGDRRANPKNTSRVVKELRKRGWIELQGNPLDERVRLVKLTVEGAEVVRLVNGALVDMARRIVANEDAKGAKEDRRPPRPLTSRARSKALMGRLIKTTRAPAQRRTKPISVR